MKTILVDNGIKVKLIDDKLQKVQTQILYNAKRRMYRTICTQLGLTNHAFKKLMRKNKEFKTTILEQMKQAFLEKGYKWNEV